MKKILIFIALVIFWVLLLFPKNLFWTYFINYMETKDIKIETVATKDMGYKFIAKDLKISYKDMGIVQIQKLTIKPWLLYNEIDFDVSKLNKNIPLLKGLKISQFKATYDILHPTYIRAKGVTRLGDFTIKIWLLKHKGIVLLKRKYIKNSFLREYFKKTKDGMRYEFGY